MSWLSFRSMSYVLVGLCAFGCANLATQIPPSGIPHILKTIPIQADPYNSVARIAINSRSGNVYLSLGTHITVLNGIDVVADLPSGQLWAEDVAVDDLNDWTYVANQNSDAVTVFHGTALIGNIPTYGSIPNAVAAENHNHWAYVVSGHAKKVNGVARIVEGNVLVLRGTQVISNLNLGELLLTHVIADPISGYVYVGATGGTVVALKGLQEVARFDGTPSGGLTASVVAMDADSRTGEVYVIDSSYTVRVFKEGKLMTSFRDVATDIEWSALRVHPVTGNIYLVASRSNLHQAAVLHDGKEIARLPVGQFPLDLEIDRLTGNVYVSNFYDGTVTVINGIEELGTIKIGRHASAIGINPNNGWVYVVDTLGQTVSVLGYSTAESAATVAPLPTSLPTRKSYP